MTPKEKAKQQIKDILTGNDVIQKRALFSFSLEMHTDKQIIRKYNIWSKLYFSKYFTSDDAPFHKEMIENTLRCYRGEFTLINSAFRGSAKTSVTKLFIAFCIANDINHHRKYIKILSADLKNSKQLCTDIYNALISESIQEINPNIFEKTVSKREEQMGSFTTSTGVKVVSGTIGQNQRGSLQEYSRPDFLICHAKGTDIFDKDKWIKVENHYSFKQYRKTKGYEVGVHCLPFNEFVTPEHRYFCKTLIKRNDKLIDIGNTWVEAQDIKKNKTYIGHKIDYRVNKIPKLIKYAGGKIIKRNKDGQIEKTKANFKKVKVYELDDVDWWYLLGVFWADGSVSRNSTGNNSTMITLYIAYKDHFILTKILNLLSKYNICFYIYDRPGCSSVVFSHALLARWLREEWKKEKNSHKVPSLWVEKISIDKQIQLMRGYIDSDGWVNYDNNEIRITSVCLDGLYCARRILARIGIPSSIRKGIKGGKKIICGNPCDTQDKFDLRFRENAYKLGYNIKNQTRYKWSNTLIKDGYLWSKIKLIKKDDEEKLYCPIKTKNSTYLTHFGTSHNCDDFENRETLRSAIKTQTIWNNMEEARTALAVGGSQIYLCNYLSESGNVHKLVETYRDSSKAKVLRIAILDESGEPTWNRYSKEMIEEMRKVDDDFEGERMNNPASSKNVYFNRTKLDKQIPSKPIKETNGFKIYKKYNPSHNYASGHDIAGGLGFDSSTSVFIDFSTFPAEVVATYYDNIIKPDVFAYEIQRQAEMFGNCLVAPESNNHGHATIAILKQLNCNIYKREPKQSKILGVNPTEYGFNTNALTKTQMLSALNRAIEDNLLVLNDIDLINELKSYTRDNAIENVPDPRLVTRHYDLLISLCIAWQMKDQRFVKGKGSSGKVFKPKFTRKV